MKLEKIKVSKKEIRKEKYLPMKERNDKRMKNEIKEKRKQRLSKKKKKKWEKN